MAVSELPGNPNAVWTVKTKEDGLFELNLFKIYKYILNNNDQNDKCLDL